MSRETGDSRKFNTSHNEPMDSVVDKYLSRRSVVRGGLGAAIAMITGVGLTGCFDSDSGSSRSDGTSPGTPGTPEPAEPVALSLGFESIPYSKTDAVVVAAGYTARVFAPWGTPLNSQANPWDADGNNTAEDQANAVGMHHDGMHYFPINGSSEDGLLVMNHEYIDQRALHPNGATLTTDGSRPVEEVRKEINAQGVSVIRITKVNGRWQIVENDPLNRRFTTASVMDLAGPLRGTEHLRTPFSRNGTQTRGTNNNCGNGYTPWGTYLSAEENWPGVFVNTSTNLPEDQSRIGIEGESNYGWETAAGDPSEVNGEFARFDITPRGASALEDYRNEANGYGYIVEIDPYNPSTRAVKRTALGRFRHEGCWPGLTEAGKPVVFYMGDDARHEYVYKFVSDALWDPADANPSDRLATGAKYMDEGTLYVARFNADGSGDWLPLTVDSQIQGGQTLGSIYGDLATIILNTRGAADALGATPMDRPEWTTVNPLNGDVYLTLTNNTARTEPNPANPRVPNPYGHIIRWHDADDQRSFTWDIFVFGAPENATSDINRSGLTNFNAFASPDGLVFDSRGILWIQTDNSGNAVAEVTNDQMLAVIPSNLVDAEGNQVAVNPENQDHLRRFFIGPNNCEVTGVSLTPDHKTMFVNIQHPRNWPYSEDATEAAPAGVTVRPRASTVVIQKIDGGEIAL